MMKTDKRQLIIHIIHHLRMGGMENGLVNLINHLPEDRFRHMVVCIEDDSEFRERIKRPDTSIVCMHRSKIGVWRLRWQLYKLFRQHQPNVVHSRNLSGLDALLPARLAGIPYCVHSEHGRDMDDLDGSNKKLALLRKLHRPFVSRYITVSKDLQQYLIKVIGVKAGQISQIYNGVDTNKFFPNPQNTGSTLTIGTVGRLQAVKDQATLLKAFAGLLASYPELKNQVRLAVVGDGPLLGELQSLAANLGVTESLWLPGKAENIPEILRGFDVFVLSSLSEGISNTILEAMASGLPCVVTAVGGNTELVKEGYNGSFFQAGNTGQLQQILASYIQNNNQRNLQGNNARQMAQDQFSLQAMLASYQHVYEKTI